MTFDEAMQHSSTGRVVRRAGWFRIVAEVGRAHLITDSGTRACALSTGDLAARDWQPEEMRKADAMAPNFEE